MCNCVEWMRIDDKSSNFGPTRMNRRTKEAKKEKEKHFGKLSKSQTSIRNNLLTLAHIHIAHYVIEMCDKGFSVGNRPRASSNGIYNQVIFA